jgi:hypothetical protein
MTPSDEWKTLDVGQRHWYAFRMPGPDKDGVAPEAKIEMQVMPASAATFELWTPQRLHEMEIKDKGEWVEPVGAGAREDTEDVVGKLIWAGALGTPGMYYVCVDQVGPIPASYRLSIAGKQVSFPPLAAAVAPVEVVAPVGAPPFPGSGPADALTPAGEWKTLGKGEEHWYAFQVPGEDKDGNAPVTHVELLATPLNSAEFAVWTPGCLCAWQKGSEDERKLPVGRGSTEEMKAGSTTDKLIWAGEFNQAGVYYVRVMQSGPLPTTYKLTVYTE